jgi:PAS domain S-box-containing protein
VRTEDFLALAAVYPDAMLLVADDGLVAAVSEAALRALDRPEGDLVSRPLTELVVDSPDAVANYLRLCGRNRDALVGSLTFRRAGVPVMFGVRGARLWKPVGEAKRFVVLRLLPKSDHVKSFLALNERVDALNREVIRRQAAERELRIGEQWLKITLLSIGDAVIATDETGRVKFMNPIAETLTGWSGVEANGLPLEEIFHIVNETTGVRVESPVDLVRKRGTVVGLVNHTVLIRRDGAQLPIADSGAPIRDPAGRMAGVVLVFRDVSEERDLERRRLDLLSHAEAAKQAAETANTAKDEFLAVLSHELRTPLSAILGWTRLLQTGKVSEGRREKAFNVIERNANVQAKLIEDVLDVSRIAAGKLDLNLTEIDLSSLVQDSVESAQPLAGAKAIRLGIATRPDGAVVRGDVRRLQQVVANLVSNAIKFSAEGSEVRVSVEMGNDSADIVVRDWGEGIDTNVVPHVFDRFRQEDSSSRRRHGGLGLGLAIVRHLVEAHQGAVTAHSDGKGTGATFRVRLPLATSGGAVTSARADPTFEASLDGIRILVVDDEPDARELAAVTLTAGGATVEGAASAREALAEIRRRRPDVIVCDIGLPGEDGVDLIRQLRSLPTLEGGATPALALTAFASPEDRSRVLWAGFQMHLAKPVEPRELVVSVASLVGRTGRGS